MNQILEFSKTGNSFIIQDLSAKESNQIVSSSVTQVKCSICNRGLEDKLTITAKKTFLGNSLFCTEHFPEINNF